MRNRLLSIFLSLLVVLTTASGSAMAKQDVTVELFYSAAWHDVTERVYTRNQIVINHGAADEQAGVVPSDASLTFKNIDGEMNPENRRSSLFGLIGHNTPIRITVAGDIRFSGQVVSWKPRRAVKGDAWVHVQAQGTIRRLGQGEPPAQSALYRLYAPSNATGFWALNEGELSSVGALTSGTGGSFRQIQGTSSLGVATLAPWIGSGLSLSQDDVTTTVSTPVTMNPTTSLVVDATFSWTAEPGPLASFRILAVPNDTGAAGGANWRVVVGGDGALVYGNEFGAGLSENNTVTGVHHLRMEVEQNGADADLTLHYDGVAQTTYTDTGYTLGDYSHLVLLYDDDPDVDSPIALSSVAVYVDATPPDIADAFGASQGFPSESAGDRFLRLCADEGITGTIVGSAAETQPMGPQYSGTILNLFGEIARTDAGIIHDTRSQLGLTFRTGRSLYNQ